jgi:hypothetical protein
MSQNHIRNAFILVTLSFVITACGGEPVDTSTEGAAPDAPSLEVGEHGAAANVALDLDLKNASASTRICKLSWLYVKADGTQVSGTIFNGAYLVAGETRGGSTYVPMAQPVTIVGGCWHPNYPTEKPLFIGSHGAPGAISSKHYLVTYSEAGEVVSTSMSSGSY